MSRAFNVGIGAFTTGIVFGTIVHSYKLSYIDKEQKEMTQYMNNQILSRRRKNEINQRLEDIKTWKRRNIIEQIFNDP